MGTSEATINAAAVPARASGVARGWIQSPAFDMALFTLAPLSGLLVVAAGRFPGGSTIGFAAMFLVAIPHYMSSFSFYLGDDNRRYFQTRRVAFHLGPVLIIGAVLSLRVLGHDAPVQNTMFVWNVWHVSLQSAGILSIYRRLNGGPLTERPVAHLAILTTSATMAFWHVDRFPPLYDALARVHPLAPWSLRTVLLPVALVSLVILAHRIWKRERIISLAEGAFLLTSLLLFHPYLWVGSAAQATFAMLMGHFIQYLAIVWLLNHRKYAASSGSRMERTLGWISARPVPLLGAIAVVGLTFYLADRATTALGLGIVYIIIWNAMTLVHFYIDGLVWAFRTPHVRESIGPYLIPSSRIVP